MTQLMEGNVDKNGNFNHENLVSQMVQKRQIKIRNKLQYNGPLFVLLIHSFHS
jgi:hypothetical protein